MLRCLASARARPGLFSVRATPVLSPRPSRLSLPPVPRCLAAAAPPPDSPPDSESQQLNEQPPQLVRAGLVGATTALMTPLFPIIGLNQLVFRYVPPEQQMAIHGGTSMLYFSVMTLMPNAFYYAPMLLPFAVGNGITAASLYFTAEIMAGGPKQLAAPKLFVVPLAGPALGLTTAFLAPFTFPYSWALVYGGTEVFDLFNAGTIYNLCFNSIMGPCLAFTGLGSGLVIDIFLRRIILGVEGWPWQKLAGRVLAAAGVGLFALYSTSTRTDIPHLRDVDLDAPELKGWIFDSKITCYVDGMEEFCWIARLHPATGELFSECLKPSFKEDGGLTFQPQGRDTDGVAKVEESQKLITQALKSTAACYPSQRLAYFDGLLEDPVGSELCKLRESLPITDAAIVDTLVILLAATVPHEKIASSLQKLQPLLAASSLAKLLGSSTSEAVFKDLEGYRAAQFRELQRLKSGRQGPFEAENLSSSLAAAGIDVKKVEQKLRELDWHLDESPALRERDWKVLGQKNREDKLAKATQLLLYGAAAAVFLAAYGQLMSYSRKFD